jgi:hypothetical protein
MQDSSNGLALVTLDSTNITTILGKITVQDPLIDARSLVIIDPKEDVDKLLQKNKRLHEKMDRDIPPDYRYPLYAKDVIFIEFVR